MQPKVYTCHRQASARAGTGQPSVGSCIYLSDPGYLGLSGLHFPQLQNGAHHIFPTGSTLTLGSHAHNLNSRASVVRLVKGASQFHLPHILTGVK